MRKWILFLTFMLSIIVVPACNKVPDDPVLKEQKKILENKGRLVEDLAFPSNVHFAKMEGVTLVQGLLDTGANEPPSNYQQLVLKELQRNNDRKVNARKEIASLTTAIVLMRAIVPPGAKKGDRVDVEVFLPPRTEATSLQGGYIDGASLHEYLAADTIREGDRLGIVNGYVTLDPNLLMKDDPNKMKRGRIIGGAVVTKDRPVWLSIKNEEQTVGVAQRLEDVINNRFSYIKNGSRRKVAEAKSTGWRIELVVPDEYKDNIHRYMKVVSAISFFESNSELNDRINELKAQLMDPSTSERASLQLEAIGSSNEKVAEAFRAGLACPNETVRFNTAISVAYTNMPKERNQAAEILADFAKSNPKFRPAALAVLGTCLKTSFIADTKLRELLDYSDKEVRYGAFRALWQRNPGDYMIQGENMADYFTYHALNCGGPALVHIANSKRPELVLFAKDQIFLQGSFNLDAGMRISVRSENSDVIVKKYSVGIDEQRIVSYRLDDVIRAIVDVGGSYSDVVDFLVKAEKTKLIAAYDNRQMTVCELAVDALPDLQSPYSKHKKNKDLLANDENETDEPDETETTIAKDSKDQNKKDNAKKKEGEKESFWDKMNPVAWFQSDKDASKEKKDASKEKEKNNPNKEKGDVKKDPNAEYEKEVQ